MSLNTGASEQAARPNIILLVLDCARAQSLSCYGYPRETTPNIDRLAEDGVVYENAFSPANWTIPSHASMFTGTYPSEHRVSGRGLRLDRQFITLAQVLKAQGYETVGFTANSLVSRITDLDRGFDRIRDVTWLLDRPNPSLVTTIIDRLYAKLTWRRYDYGARRVNRLIRGWLSRREASGPPFFLFVNYLETHLKYDPPGKFKLLFQPQGVTHRRIRRVPQRPWDYMSGALEVSEEDFKILTALYDAELRYADYRVGQLVEFLQARSLMDNTVLVVTSDHGENVGDHGLMDHQFSVYNSLIHVPLIVRYPEAFPPGQRITEIVQTLDIFPTLMDLLGIDDEDAWNQVQGWSILPNRVRQRPQFAVSEDLAPQMWLLNTVQGANERGLQHDRQLRAYITLAHKYIWASNGQEELYDWTVDPGEMNNLINDEPGIAGALRSRLDEWVSAHGSASEQPTGEIDDAVMERLKGLGYIA